MIITILIAVVLAGLRIAGITHEAYQAAAHLFVGALLGAWWVEREGNRARMNLYTAIVLTVVEVGAFLWFRFVAE